MKKILIGLLVLLFFLAPTVAAEDFNAAAQNVIAVEANTGKILYEKEATSPVSIASISKLLTAYLVYQAIEEGKLTMDSQVEISDYAYQLTTNYNISNLPMENRTYSVKELLEAMLIANANSAAIALAEKVAGSEKDFVDLMREKLQSWGISDVTIVNATGLNNQELGEHIYPNSEADAENKMSATAVAILARRLIKDFPQVVNITEKSSSTFSGFKISSSNYMLENMPYYRAGIDGLKTGISEQAGASFVATTTEKGMRLITVVLKADNAEQNSFAHFTATADLLDYLSQNFTATNLLEKGQSYKNSQVAVANGKNSKVEAVASKDLTIIQKVDSEKSPKITFNPKNSDFEAPLAKNTTIGRLSYKDNELIGQGYLDKQEPTISMVAKNKVERSFFLKVWWNSFVKFVNEKL